MNMKQVSKASEKAYWRGIVWKGIINSTGQKRGSDSTINSSNGKSSWQSICRLFKRRCRLIRRSSRITSTPYSTASEASGTPLSSYGTSEDGNKSRRTTQLQRELSLTGFASDINRQLQELKEIKESMGTFSNDHPHWAQVVKECVSTVEYYFSGDNTALQLCSLGEVVSGMIQELLTRTFEGAIECINKLKILFRIAADKSAFMNLFRSADILINSSWLLLEYGSRAAAGDLQLAIPIDQRELMKAALSSMTLSAEFGTDSLQSSFLDPRNLDVDEHARGMSDHELRRAGRTLFELWSKCSEHVFNTTLYNDKEDCSLPQNCKMEILCELLRILTNAANTATEMQLSFQDPESMVPILAARRKKDTTIAADEVNTEVVQRHLWLWPCVLDLFNHADTTAEALKSNFRCMDESLQKILREMSLAVYAMVLVSTGRIIWLLRKPESVDPWSLRILKGQAIELKTLIEVHGKKLQDIQDGFPECNQGDAEIGDLEKSLTILETLISAAQRSVQKPKGRNENAASSSKATRSLARSQSKSGLLTQQLRGEGCLSLKQVLGEGSSGRVYAAEFYKGYCAVKVLKEHENLQGQNELENEWNMLRYLGHPHVVRHLGYIADFWQKGKGYGPALIMELCGSGTLFNLISGASEFCDGKKREEQRQSTKEYLLYKNWSRRLRLAQGLASGLCYLHSSKIIHKDLTSYNVLIGLDNSWEAKICDFGHSTFFGEKNETAETSILSPAWSAPEVEREGYSVKSDIYSFGVVLWELALLEHPCKKVLLNGQVAYWKESDSDSLHLPESLDSNQPSFEQWGEYRALIEVCLSSNRDERPEINEISSVLHNLICDRR